MTANINTMTEADFVELLKSDAWTEAARHCDGCGDDGEVYELEPDVNGRVRRVRCSANVYESYECEGVRLTIPGSISWLEERDEDDVTYSDRETWGRDDIEGYLVSVRVFDAAGNTLSGRAIAELVDEHWTLAARLAKMFEDRLPQTEAGGPRNSLDYCSLGAGMSISIFQLPDTAE